MAGGVYITTGHVSPSDISVYSTDDEFEIEQAIHGVQQTSLETTPRQTTPHTGDETPRQTTLKTAARVRKKAD